MVSFTGISSGVATTTSPVVAGSLEDVEHPVGLLADQADLHQLVDGLGRGQLADDVPAGGGVDDHQVVVALLAPPSTACRRSGSP